MIACKALARHRLSFLRQDFYEMEMERAAICTVAIQRQELRHFFAFVPIVYTARGHDSHFLCNRPWFDTPWRVMPMNFGMMHIF